MVINCYLQFNSKLSEAKRRYAIRMFHRNVAPKLAPNTVIVSHNAAPHNLRKDFIFDVIYTDKQRSFRRVK